MSAGQEISHIINSSKLEHMSSSTNVSHNRLVELYQIQSLLYMICKFLFSKNLISCDYGESAPGDGFSKGAKLSFRLTN